MNKYKYCYKMDIIFILMKKAKDSSDRLKKLVSMFILGSLNSCPEKSLLSKYQLDFWEYAI